MMQVFSTVNALLARDPAARRRALAIRTYRVVPLTPDSGVLEYVGNTKVRACVEDAGTGGGNACIRVNHGPRHAITPHPSSPHSPSAPSSSAPARPATRASTPATTRGT